MKEQLRAPAVREAGAKPPLMRSSAHRSHVDLGATFETRGAWEVPASYGPEPREIEAIRSGLAIADISARGKLHLTGSIDPLLQRLTGDALEPMRTASIASAAGRVARVARDWALVLLPPSVEGEILAAIDEEAAVETMATDFTSAMSAFLVAGPRLTQLFARSVTFDVAEIRAGRCLAGRWARIPAVLVVTDFGGSSVELYVGSEHGRYAWGTLMELGGECEGVAVGWRVLESSGWK